MNRPGADAQCPEKGATRKRNVRIFFIKKPASLFEIPWDLADTVGSDAWENDPFDWLMQVGAEMRVARPPLLHRHDGAICMPGG